MPFADRLTLARQRALLEDLIHDALYQAKLSALPFADQVDVIRVGFGLWQANARAVSGSQV